MYYMNIASVASTELEAEGTLFYHGADQLCVWLLLLPVPILVTAAVSDLGFCCSCLPCGLLDVVLLFVPLSVSKRKSAKTGPISLLLEWETERLLTFLHVF